jgi:histidinol dehydrogenase
MTAVPARVAGVPDVVVACPRPAPAVLAAALEAGVTTVYRVGGAQAVAALAYGTDLIARVDKIVGPGSVWVAAAKRMVAGDCGVDLDAGPSEIVVWSSRGDPDWIAADLIAQAEHDPDARSIFVTTRARLAERVRGAVDERLRQATVDRQPGARPARQAIRNNGAVVLAGSRRDAIAVVDRLAPEHLVVDSRRDAGACRAGTVFVGPWSAQAAGDYCTGSNHVLPTGGAAVVRGGLSAMDFQRIFSVQTVTRGGIRAIAPAAATLADAEGLAAHAASIRLRLP